MDELTRTESANKRKGLIFSVVFHTVAIILLALFGLSFQNPPPEQGGILVNLGIPEEMGTGNENAPEGKPAEAAEEPEPEPEKEEVPPPREKPKKEVEKPKPTPEKPVVKTEDPEAIALKKKKEEEKKRQETEARERQEAERKRKEAETAEAKRKADEAKKQQELKDQIGGALGGGKGKGKGNSGKTGNPGDPNGDPNSDVLTGISTGSGVVGGGLGNRGVVKKGAPISDNSQEEGTMYLDICVDQNGNVISAEYTQRGSTVNSSRLKQLAIQNAKQWKFKPGEVDKQCGTIRYDFKLK